MNETNLNALWFVTSAAAFLPKLNEVENADMNDEKLNTLRMQETLFTLSVLAGGAFAAFGSKRTMPFGISVIAAFIIVSVYEGKANGYEIP